MCVCVCVLRADGTRHADGARVGDAQQTRRGHARSSTHTNQASGPSTPGSVKAPASPCSGSSAPSGCAAGGARSRAAAGDATRAEDPHAVAELEGEPLGQRTRDALAVEAAERARTPATGRAGLPCGVHPRHLPQGTGRRAVEAAIRLVDERPHLHRPLQRAVVVGLLVCVKALPR